MKQDQKDHITVCICTYHRNELLERLLRKLAAQNTDGRFSFSVVVVDNDAEAPAQATVRQLASELGLDVTYGVETERAIPAVRNHALRLARGNYIGIIDDDEFPSSHWLLNLYHTIHTFDVDGAFGPVIPFFDEHPPEWLLKSGFCELPVHRTGTLLRWNQAYTGNVMLKKKVFEEHGIAFNTQFRTGGSDQEFFQRAMGLGYRFVASAEAPAYEVVPPKRWTMRYWVKRALVNGFNSRQYAARQKRPSLTVALMLKSSVALVAYLLTFPVCVCLGTHAFMKSVTNGSYHLSRLCAVVGIQLWNRRDF